MQHLKKSAIVDLKTLLILNSEINVSYMYI